MKSILTLCAIAFFISTKAQSNPPIADTANVIVDPIRIQVTFPGGVPAWRKYLQGHLHAEIAADNIVLRKGQKDSLETVVVSFLVDTSGNITEVKVENPDYVNPKVGAEAVRVIQQGPKWLPATMTEAKGVYRQRQSISFQVTRG